MGASVSVHCMQYPQPLTNLYRGKKRVLYDRPPSHFRRTTPGELHEVYDSKYQLMNRLMTGLFQLFPRVTMQLDSDPLDNFLPSYEAPTSTPFTRVSATIARNVPTTTTLLPSHGMPHLRDDRPAMIVSSTSWTADEDFGILIKALQMYELSARATHSDLPKLLCLITGKGPLQQSYMNRVKGLQIDEQWEFVRCDNVWLEPEDYPLLLGMYISD